MKDYIVVFSMKMTVYLMQNGFVLNQIRKDNYADRNVFIFRDTKQLR